MEDKKNIVIKLKYAAAEKRAENQARASGVVTEWNIKRIALALAGVVLLVAAALFFVPRQDAQKPDLQPQTQAALPEKVVAAPVKPDITSSNVVSRALLAFEIKHNEPVGEISLPLKLGKNKATSVYYFVELTGMKSRTVYHEWLLDGELITRKKVHITDDGKWRSFSRQLLAYAAKNNWTVRLVDETGQVLNEIPVDVVYE